MSNSRATKIPFLTAFLDTNYFYEYPDIGAVKWPEALGAVRVRLIILPIILRELNNHKDGGRKPQLAKRAASTLRNLNSYLVTCLAESNVAPVRTGVDILFEHRDAPIELPLNPQVADDWLIAGILTYRSENASEPLRLITEDVGLKIKARQFGIEIAPLPESYRTSTPLDPNARRVQELERLLDESQNRSPLLEVRFNDSPGNETLTVSIPRLLTNADISALLAEIKEQVPLLTIESPEVPPLVKRRREFRVPLSPDSVVDREAGTAHSEEEPNGEADERHERDPLAHILELLGEGEDAFDATLSEKERAEYQAQNEDYRKEWEAQHEALLMTSTQLVSYNEDVARYYTACETHFKANLPDLNRRRRSFLVDTLLCNRGRGTATDVDIELRLPAGVTIGLPDRTSPRPEGAASDRLALVQLGLPPPPAKPKPPFFSAFGGLSESGVPSTSELLRRNYASAAMPHHRNVSSWNVVSKEKSSITARVHVESAKVGQDVGLGKLLVTPPDDNAPLVIGYSISAHEGGSPHEGELAVTLLVYDTLLPA